MIRVEGTGARRGRESAERRREAGNEGKKGGDKYENILLLIKRSIEKKSSERSYIKHPVT